MFAENLLPKDAAIYFQLARFFIVLGAGVLTTRLLVMPAASKLLKKKGSDRKSRHSAVNIVGLVSLFVSFTVALQAGQFGSLVTLLGTVAAAATVAIGFGMRDQVSNIMAGIFLHFDNPFIRGDYIKTGETQGVVKEINLRSTVLNGRSSEKVVVPNAQLTTGEVKNFTKSSKTKTSIHLDLEPGKITEATGLIEEIVKEHEQVLENPAPEIFYSDTDGKINAELHYWIKDSSRAKTIKSQVLEEFNSRAEGKDIFGEEKE